MQAAIESAGVVLGWRSLARADLEAGRLTIPFDLPLPMEVGFYLVYPEADAGRFKLAAFRGWLLAETATARSTAEAEPVRPSRSRAGRRPTGRR
jgi:LysR family glycine cleavage system transcriptional activator